jgi:hypothetical protein
MRWVRLGCLMVSFGPIRLGEHMHAAVVLLNQHATREKGLTLEDYRNFASRLKTAMEEYRG